MKFRILTFMAFLMSWLCGCAQSGFQNADVQEFEKITTGKNSVVILDVRTSQEFADGHIKSAVNIDVKAENFKDETLKTLTDKNQVIAVYCRSGRRSVTAANILVSEGYKNVVNLKGGILAWQSEGKEVEK
ncbi:MAG: rhodanese-like domain-containing protein [Bacteroidales bacterium]|nr:rhodanese-like domain-containing protein [Bacteroidales bacterium]